MNAPTFEDPELEAELAATLSLWAETDARLGAFATIASQRARIAELESEVDRRTELWQRSEAEAAELRRRLAAAEAAAGAARPALPRLPGRR